MKAVNLLVRAIPVGDVVNRACPVEAAQTISTHHLIQSGCLAAYIGPGIFVDAYRQLSVLWKAVFKLKARTRWHDSLANKQAGLSALGRFL